MASQITRRAAIELGAASVAYFALPVLSSDLQALALSKRSLQILAEIERYKLARIKRWHGEKPAYPFAVSFEEAKDALPIFSDFNSSFGVRGTKRKVRYGKFKNRGVHWGIDIRAPIGTPVLAGHDGKATQLNDKINGQQIMLEDTSIFTIYAHLGSSHLKPGQEVKRGDIVGEVGTTGEWGRVSHLHLQVHEPWGDGIKNPHLFWYDGKDLEALTFGNAKTNEKARIIMFRPGKAYPTEFGNPRILTYPLPGVKDMPYFLDKLEQLKRK